MQFCKKEGCVQCYCTKTEEISDSHIYAPTCTLCKSLELVPMEELYKCNDNCNMGGVSATWHCSFQVDHGITFLLRT